MNEQQKRLAEIIRKEMQKEGYLRERTICERGSLGIVTRGITMLFVEEDRICPNCRRREAMLVTDLPEGTRWRCRSCGIHFKQHFNPEEFIELCGAD